MSFLDTMQVEVIRTYTAKQPDELSLQMADVVLVSQTVEDGMLSLNLVLVLSTASLFHLPVSTVSFHFHIEHQKQRDHNSNTAHA